MAFSYVVFFSFVCNSFSLFRVVRDEREAIAPALSRFNGFASKLIQAAGVSGYEQLVHTVKCRKDFSTDLRFYKTCSSPFLYFTERCDKSQILPAQD